MGANQDRVNASRPQLRPLVDRAFEPQGLGSGWFVRRDLGRSWKVNTCEYFQNSALLKPDYSSMSCPIEHPRFQAGPSVQKDETPWRQASSKEEKPSKCAGPHSGIAGHSSWNCIQQLPVWSYHDSTSVCGTIFVKEHSLPLVETSSHS